MIHASSCHAICFRRCSSSSRRRRLARAAKRFCSISASVHGTFFGGSVLLESHRTRGDRATWLDKTVFFTIGDNGPVLARCKLVVDGRSVVSWGWLESSILVVLCKNDWFSWVNIAEDRRVASSRVVFSSSSIVGVVIRRESSSTRGFSQGTSPGNWLSSCSKSSSSSQTIVPVVGVGTGVGSFGAERQTIWNIHDDRVNLIYLEQLCQ